MHRKAAGGENLPKTAGELPVLAILGAICLAAAGVRKAAVRKR
jgi:hypothetical protein